MRRRLALALLALLLPSGCAARRPVKPKPAPTKAKAVVRTARSYLPEETTGKRKTPKDCSDYVQRVYSENGLKLPRTAVEMSLLGKRIKSSKDLRMGDLVFFSGDRVSRIVGHVGIYVNNGIFIHVSRPEVGARMESLFSDYYRKRYLTARRVID